MAASPAVPKTLTIVDLRQLRRSDLEPILIEQSRCWRERFCWDLSPAAATLGRFLDGGQLHGYALVCGGRAVGYSYYVQDESKALIGDLYLLERWRDAEAERILLQRTLEAAALRPGVRRIEGQLMALSFEPSEQRIFRRPVRTFPRLYMAAAELAPPPSAARLPGVRLQPWTEPRLDAAAVLIAEAYQGHIDAEINDQYRSYTGARRFLASATRHTGCGEFLTQASWTAGRPSSLRMEGLCLASRIEAAAGHITQLCVDPQRRRCGLGTALLYRSMAAQAALGLRTVTLTVTEQNRAAVALYERAGFCVRKRFPALVWEAE